MYSNLRWKGGYIMAEDMQTMLSLILSEMREMRSEMSQMKSDFEQRFDKQDAQLTALIKGQTALTNSMAEIRDNLSAKIEETQKDNKDNREVSEHMLYDIALLKTKVK